MPVSHSRSFKLVLLVITVTGVSIAVLACADASRSVLRNNVQEATSSADARPSESIANVEVLKHPYPYEASLTAISDTHKGTTEPLGRNVLEFEAIHRLLNGHEMISRDSDTWKILGLSNELSIANFPHGIPAFEFPFADTFWFYDEYFGMFKDYDVERMQFVRHDGIDLEQKFLEWHRRGYVGTLHTFGMGKITRDKAQAALTYFKKNLKRPLTIYNNHSASRAPCGCAAAHCTLLNQVLVDMRYRVFQSVGKGGRLRAPTKLPGALKEIGYAVIAVSLFGHAGLGYIVFRWWKKHRPSFWSVFIFMVAAWGTMLALYCVPVDYCKGDNPRSPYYNIDLLKQSGVRFFNTMSSDYWRGSVDTTWLPEHNGPLGRPSILHKYRFDDGTYGWMFQRCKKDSGPLSFQLLSKSNLEGLCARSGWSILYLHWNTMPTSYFTAENLAYLEVLRAFRDQKRIWVASADDVLAHAYAYAHTRFRVEERKGERHIVLVDFFDPTTGPRPIKLAEVRNLSFRCPLDRTPVIWVDGKRLSPESITEIKTGDFVILTIR